MKNKSFLIIFAVVFLAAISILTNANSTGRESVHNSSETKTPENKSSINTSELPIAPVDKSKIDNTPLKKQKDIGETHESLMNNAFENMIHNINQ